MNRDEMHRALQHVERTEQDLLAALRNIVSATSASTRDGFLVSRLEAFELCLTTLLADHRKILQALAARD